MPRQRMLPESLVSILLYLLAAACWAWAVFVRGAPTPGARRALIGIGAIAIALHGAILYQKILTGAGLNMGFFNALSLVSWTVAAMVTLAALLRPVENLALVFLPAAALCLLSEQLFPSRMIVPGSGPIGLRVHIVLSIGAYGVLAIAAVQAVILSLQERQLRARRPVGAMRLLPPLQVMEEFMVQMLALGFFLLSLSLATGLMFLDDLLGQHLAHKTVLSTLAWLIFGYVLYGRWSRGWRGQRLAGWTLGGFVSLMLAYFGSKFVLELILHRV